MSIAFDYQASSVTPTSLVLARAGFGANVDVLELFAIAGADVRCLTFSSNNLGGVGRVRITGLGTNQVDCYLDNAHVASTSVVVPANFQLVLGAKGLGAAQVVVDNVVISGSP